MNREMRNILSKFILRCVVITCLLCFCAGAVTAKQRSEYNSYFTPYAVLTLKNTGNAINLTLDERRYSFDMTGLKELANYRSSVYFTPISGVVFFFDSFFSLFSTFKG